MQASTALAGISRFPPRATLTPVYFRDPPIWDTDVGPIPEELDELMAPLPSTAAPFVKVGRILMPQAGQRLPFCCRWRRKCTCTAQSLT